MAKKKDNYETKMNRLEEVVSLMESSELTLDESLERYEEGIKLYKELYKLLQEAEGKIKLLTDDGEVEFAEQG
jgi:exodeoxyribonuclease VII small subunit